MNYRSDAFYFVEATLEDGDAILEILEEPDFEGDLRIIYTRRPNPVTSFLSEGKEVMLLLCKEKSTDLLVGFGCCTIREHYVDGKAENVGYLSGLRAKKEYRNIPFLLVDAYEELINWIGNKGIKFIYTTVLDDNKSVQKMFEKKRKKFPAYLPIGEYNVYCATSKQRKPNTKGYKMGRATQEDLPSLIEFIKEKGCQRDLFPVLSKEDLLGNTRLKLHFSNYYIALDSVDGKIVAAIYVWQQHEHKQHIIYAYNGVYKLLRHIAPILPYLGYPRLPKAGSELSYYTLSFYVYREQGLDCVDELIRFIASDNKVSNYFLIGMIDTDPLNQVMSKLAKMTYKSRVYRVDYLKNGEAEEKIPYMQRTYIECGLL